MAKLKAPRTLSSEQQKRVADKLKQWAGQQFTGLVASSVSNAWPLWVTLEKTLTAAKWIRIAPIGLSMGDPAAGIPVAPNDGVTIYVPKGDSTLVDLAIELVSALNKEGIKSFGTIQTDLQMRPKIIVVEVGTKPKN